MERWQKGFSQVHRPQQFIKWFNNPSHPGGSSSFYRQRNERRKCLEPDCGSIVKRWERQLNIFGSHHKRLEDPTWDRSPPAPRSLSIELIFIHLLLLLNLFLFFLAELWMRDRSRPARFSANEINNALWGAPCPSVRTGWLSQNRSLWICNSG